MEQLELQFDSSDGITQLKKDLKSCKHWLLLCHEIDKGNYNNVLSFCNKITDYIISHGLVNELGWSYVPTVKRLSFKNLDELDLTDIKSVAELLASEKVKEFPHFAPNYKSKIK